MKARVSLLASLKRYFKGLQPINISIKSEIVSPNNLLSGKTAVVTGASRGIGLTIAKIYVEHGATVIAIAKNSKTLLEGKKFINSDRYIPIDFDLTNFEQYQELYETIVSKAPLGIIDILVNSAGLKNGQEEKFWEFNAEEFDACIAVNAKAPFFLSRMIAKNMILNKVNGSIINIGGIKSFIGEASPYSMSKFAQNSLTKGLARMLAPYNICVNGISPGATNTNGLDNIFLSDTPNGRYAMPEEIANIALLLASNLTRSMVGSIVVCDGGEMLQYRNNRF